LKQAIIQNLFVTAGKATLGLIVSIGTSVINIIFDYVFMVMLDMGITG
jgi:Na+-driven multidrug efflux pump